MDMLPTILAPHTTSRALALPPRARERFARKPVSEQTHGQWVKAHDGRQLRLRDIRADDVDAIKRCFKRLSPEDIRRRFLHAMSELPQPMAQRLCRIDPELERALVLEDDSVVPGEIRGVGRIYVDPFANSAEFSVLVERAWSRQGLGALLMQHLVDECRQRDLSEIWGYVLLENRPMLQLCKQLGFTRRLAPDEPGTAQISLLL